VPPPHRAGLGRRAPGAASGRRSPPDPRRRVVRAPHSAKENDMNKQSLGAALPLSRRRALALLGAGGLAAVTAGCAGPGSNGGDSQSSAEDISTDGPIEGEISFAHWRAEDQSVLEEMFAQFTEEHSEASINQDISPSNDYQSNALQRIRSGNIGDLFVAFRGAQFVDMVDAGLYMDLSGTDVVDLYTPDRIEVGQQKIGRASCRE